jgi:hypothetical protein
VLPVAGKLWCVSGNKVFIMNPLSLNVEHTIVIDGEKSVLLANTGTSTGAVWIVGQHSLDVKLYHSTKFTIITETNIKKSVLQKLSSKKMMTLLSFGN